MSVVPKLTPEQRAEIGQAYGKRKAADLADEYGISIGYVCRIWADWRLENRIPTNGPKIKVRSSSSFDFAGPPPAYLAKLKCEPVEPDPIVGPGEGHAITDCFSWQCLWPIGVTEDGERRFCGRMRYGRKSYCGAHYTKSLMRTDEKLPEAYIVGPTGVEALKVVEEFLEAA